METKTILQILDIAIKHSLSPIETKMMFLIYTGAFKQ
jgi:hypothetical protein